MTQHEWKKRKGDKGYMRAAELAKEELLLSVEGHLQTSLHPVAPSPEFISKLKNRLITQTPPVLETESSAMSMLVIAFGLLTGVIILLLGKLAIVILVAGIGFWISRWKKKNIPIQI